MAISSKTEICNLALDMLGGNTVLNIDNPETATEEVAERWYDQTRKQVLREHPWKFAIKRVVLAPSNVAPVYEYSTAFPVPSDFIRLLDVQNSDGQTLFDDYQLENHEGGLAVLSRDSATTLRLRYIFDITDISKFSADFITYLAMTLALAMAYKMTQSNTNVERVKAIRDDLGLLSKSISGQERRPTRIERSNNRQARRTGSYRRTHLITF